MCNATCKCKEKEEKFIEELDKLQHDLTLMCMLVQQDDYTLGGINMIEVVKKIYNDIFGENQEN